MAIDVAVVHALHYDLPSAARDNKCILSMTEDSKRQQSQRLYRTAGWNVGPFVATTMGAWGPAAQSLMNRVVKAQALRTGNLFQEMAREIKDLLSATVTYVSWSGPTRPQPSLSRWMALLSQTIGTEATEGTESSEPYAPDKPYALDGAVGAVCHDCPEHSCGEVQVHEP